MTVRSGGRPKSAIAKGALLEKRRTASFASATSGRCRWGAACLGRESSRSGSTWWRLKWWSKIAGTPLRFEAMKTALAGRVYLVDVLACPCGGRRAIVRDISDSEVVVAILAHLGRLTEALSIARERSPGFDFT
jgi:hypothetical protein